MKILDQKIIEDEIKKRISYIEPINKNQLENGNFELDLEFNYRYIIKDALNALKNNLNIHALGFHCCQNICDQDLEVLNTLYNMRKFYIFDSNCRGGFISYLNDNIQYLSCNYTPIELSNYVYFNRFSNLKYLFLDFCDVNEKSLKLLSESNIAKLHVLYIQGAQFSQKTKFYNEMQELERLSLGFSTGVDNIISFLKFTPRLKSLELCFTDIDDNSFAEIIGNDTIANIDYLDLSKTKITDRSLSILSQSKLQSIKSLCLNETEVSEKGFSFFEGTPLSQSVTSLKLNSVKNKIELDRIMEIFPNIFLLDVPFDWFNNDEFIRNHSQDIFDSMNNRLAWEFDYRPNGREDSFLVTCRKKTYSHICQDYYSQQRRNDFLF